MNRRLILQETKDYFFITLGLILFAFGWAVFLLPYKTISGGVTGIAAIIFYATNFKLENTYFLINAALLVVGLKILGFKFLMKTIYAIIALFWLLKWAQWMMPKDDLGLPIRILGEGQNFMSLLIGCTLTGVSMAIVFLNNGSTGGTDIIAASINKYHNVSLGQVLVTIDILIISSCLLIPEFGNMYDRLRMGMFGLCTMVVENVVLDYVMNARRQSVQFLIFSKKYNEIARAVSKHLDRGATILDGHGWYTGDEVKVLCILAKKREGTMIFRLIKAIDPDAFVSQSAVIGVYGEGFDMIKHKAHSAIKEEK